MSDDIDRIARAERFVGAFILAFSALMPLLVVLYREISGLSDTDIETNFLSLRDDGVRLDEFRRVALELPDSFEQRNTFIALANRAIELCRFRAAIAHGIIGGDRIHDDPEIVPNFFHANTKFKKITLSEANMRRYMRHIIDASNAAKVLLPKGVKIDLGAHSLVIEEVGGKSSEEIFEELKIPMNERDKGKKNVVVKFVYSVSRTVSGGAILQFHDQVRIQRVSGESDKYGMPTIRQLHIAERDFLEQWQKFEPNGYLIQFEAVPEDGQKGRYSEYRAYLPA